MLRGVVDGRQLEIPVTLAPHEQRMVTLAADVLVEHPRLWWCHNMGSPERYDLHMEFVEGATVSDTEDIRFGIREVAHEPETIFSFSKLKSDWK